MCNLVRFDGFRFEAPDIEKFCRIDLLRKLMNRLIYGGGLLCRRWCEKIFGAHFTVVNSRIEKMCFSD